MLPSANTNLENTAWLAVLCCVVLCLKVHQLHGSGTGMRSGIRQIGLHYKGLA